MVVENKHLGKGSIILMHNGAKDTPEALESIIKGLQAPFLWTENEAKNLEEARKLDALYLRDNMPICYEQ